MQTSNYAMLILVLEMAGTQIGKEPSLNQTYTRKINHTHTTTDPTEIRKQTPLCEGILNTSVWW